MDNSLVKLDQAKQLLAEVNSVEEAKDIIDTAAAAEIYAKKILKSEEAEMYARSIKFEAQRKAGEFLKEAPKNQGGNPNLTGNHIEPVATLKDIGVTKKQSSDWQQLADIPEESFEQIKAGKKTIKRAKSEVRRAARIEKEKELETDLPKSVQIIHGDFKKIEIDTVDLILTDPPYPKEFLPLWSDLGEKAAKVLKPGGFLVAYSGQLHLPEVIQRLGEHLEYYWTFCLYHTGVTQIVHTRNVMCRWKPVLIFQKGISKLPYPPQDYVESGSREKDGHDWQQSESGARKLIDTFSQPGDTVLDPFCGSGTFPFVAHKMRRNTIGIEINEDSYLISKSRFND